MWIIKNQINNMIVQVSGLSIQKERYHFRSVFTIYALCSNLTICVAVYSTFLEAKKALEGFEEFIKCHSDTEIYQLPE